MSKERDNLLEQLSAYLDGELSAAESLGVKAALANDASLAEELRNLQTTRELLRSIPDEPAPDYLSDRILARMNRNVDDRFQRRPMRNARWITYATAAVVLVTVGLGYLAILRTETGVTQGDGIAVVESEAPPVPAHGRGMGAHEEADVLVTPPDMMTGLPSASESAPTPESIGDRASEVYADAGSETDIGGEYARRDSSIAVSGRETDDTADGHLDWVTTATGAGADIGSADILDGAEPGDEPLVVMASESETAEAFGRALGQFNEVLAGNSIPVENIRFRDNMVEIDVVADVATVNRVVDQFADIQANDSAPVNMLAVAMPVEEADDIVPMLRAPTAEVQQPQSVGLMTNGAAMLKNQGNTFSVADAAVQESVNQLRTEEEKRYHRQVVVARNAAPTNKPQAEVLELPSDHQRVALLGKDRGDTGGAGGIVEGGGRGASTDGDDAETADEDRESVELELATLGAQRNVLLAQIAKLEQELDDLARFGSKMSASRASAEEASRRNTLQDIRKRLVNLDEQIAGIEAQVQSVTLATETPAGGAAELPDTDETGATTEPTQKVRFVLQEITPETAGLYRMYAEALELGQATRHERYDQLRATVAEEMMPAEEAEAPAALVPATETATTDTESND